MVGGKGREERVKATVMMKHFLFNESGENQEEMISMLLFSLRKKINKMSRSLLRCWAALLGGAVTTPHANPSHLQTSRSHPLRKSDSRPLLVESDGTSNQIKVRSSSPPPQCPLKSASHQTASFILSSWQGVASVALHIIFITGSRRNHRCLLRLDCGK